MAVVKGLVRRVFGRLLERRPLSTSYKVAKGYPRRYFRRKGAPKVLSKDASTKDFGYFKKAKTWG